MGILQGAVKLGNFQRGDNKLKKIVYLLTPSGLSERLRLTKDYLARKKVEYEALKAEIEALEKDESVEFLSESQYAP